MTDDLYSQIKSGRKLNELDFKQATITAIKQGLIGAATQGIINFGITKFKAKYGQKNVEDALDDFVQHPDKYVDDGVVGTGSYLENLAKYKQLFKEGKITELFSELKKTTAFPKMGNTRVRKHADLLDEYKAKYGETASNYPYSKTNPVTDFELAETGYFVRVYSGESKSSFWIFRIEDLRQYGSVDEIVEKLALPSKPLKVGLVEVPQGIILRKSVAGLQNWSNGTIPKGGGIQYEIIGNIEEKWFKNMSTIDELLK